jgi:hypothetical protein
MHALYLLLDHNVVTLNQYRAGHKVYFVKIHYIHLKDIFWRFHAVSLFTVQVLEWGVEMGWVSN